MMVNDTYVPTDEEVQHRLEVGYVVMGFIIGVLLLMIILLAFITRKEISNQIKRLCRPAYQMEIQTPKGGENYQYLQGYVADHVDGAKSPYL